uniref:CCHC-type domain-containing protein n=1 Tax=Caenorhabditis japonica TaxID=281687 RepID=A0A8R1EI72_CAEJA
MSSPDQELVRMLVEAIKPELKSIAKQEERAPVLNKLAEIPEATTPVEVKEATEWLRRRNADLVLLDTDPEALKMIEKVSTLTAATGAGAGGSSEAMQMMIMSRLLSDNARKRKASPPQRPTNWFRGESSERRQFGARGFAQARTTGGTFKSYVNSTPKNPRCFQCHQVGHFAANCHARRYDFSRKAHPLRGVLGSVALPFGLSTAPWLFTKLFRPLVTKWRAEGIWVWLYLDDGLVLAKSWEESQRAKQIVKGDLERAGVCLAEEKCNWVPQSSFCWLGLQGDLVAGTVKLTAKRRKKVEEAIECLYRSQAPTVLDRMKLLGQLSAMTVIAGPTGVARARRMMEVVAEAQSSETGQKVRITKTPGEVKELLYWRDRIREDPVNTFEESFNPVWELYTDASAIGMGAVLKDKKDSRHAVPVELTSSTISMSYRKEGTYTGGARKHLLDRLKELAGDGGRELWTTILNAPELARAGNTVKAYENANKRRLRWLHDTGFPDGEPSLLLYLAHINKTVGSSSMSQAVAAFQMSHNSLQATENALATALVKAKKREEVDVRTPRKEVTKLDILAILETAKEARDVKSERDALIALLSWSALLRSEEAAN